MKELFVINVCYNSKANIQAYSDRSTHLHWMSLLERAVKLPETYIIARACNLNK